MLLEIVSYNGHVLNDASFSAWFPAGQPSMPGATPNYAARARTWQKLSSKEIQPATLSFHIECKGTIHSQWETLKAWFPVNDFTFRSLIVQDLADSNRQWYVEGYAIQPIAPAAEGAGEYVVTLAIDEPLWRTVTVASDAWAITASAQTKVLTVLGNHAARPILSIDINALKFFGYAYRLWKPWYNPLTIESAEPLEVTNGGLNTTNLVTDTSKSNQINQGGGIDASTLSIPVDTAVGGGLPAGGGMCIVDTEQILYTSISGGTMTVTAGGRGYGGTTAATHADNAVMKLSQLMANLQDLRVLMDGPEVDSWNSGVGSATKIWINAKYQPKIEMVLEGSISNVAAVPFTVYVEQTAANLAALRRLPAQFFFQIDNEVFVGGGANFSAYAFGAFARAQRGTAAAAHADGATIRWLEHDIWIVWGDAQATAQVTDDTRKPIINLSTSTNASWVYADFGSYDNLRTGSWKAFITLRLGTESYIYTATQGAYADPHSVMGVAAKVWMLNGLPKAENFKFGWQLYHPAGFTTVTVTGSKRRLSTDWPATMALLKSALGTAPWSVVFNEATPATTPGWVALATHSAVALGAGTWQYLQFYFANTVAGTSGNEIDMEIADATLVIESTRVPQVAFATAVESAYYLNATITVVETGDAISLVGPLKTGDTIVVDCDAETIRKNGGEAGIVIKWNTVREGWLDLPSPQQSATCTLRYDETGVADVDIVVAWEHRNTL